jgi:hypothetical protein
MNPFAASLTFYGVFALAAARAQVTNTRSAGGYRSSWIRPDKRLRTLPALIRAVGDDEFGGSNVDTRRSGGRRGGDRAIDGHSLAGRSSPPHPACRMGEATGTMDTGGFGQRMGALPT